jgi:hypothetical protein
MYVLAANHRGRICSACCTVLPYYLARHLPPHSGRHPGVHIPGLHCSVVPSIALKHGSPATDSLSCHPAPLQPCTHSGSPPLPPARLPTGPSCVPSWARPCLAWSTSTPAPTQPSSQQSTPTAAASQQWWSSSTPAPRRPAVCSQCSPTVPRPPPTSRAARGTTYGPMSTAARTCQ